MAKFYNIHFNYLTFTEKPVSSENIDIVEYDKNGNVALDEKGQPKIEVIKNTPMLNIQSIPHLAVRKATEYLNKKYNLGLKTYDIFGGKDIYISKYHSKICERIDEQNDENNNIIKEIFTKPATYNGKSMYMNINNVSVATALANDLIKIIETENKDMVFPLSESCIYKLYREAYMKVNIIFEDLKTAKRLMQNNQEFLTGFGNYM